MATPCLFSTTPLKVLNSHTNKHEKLKTYVNSHALGRKSFKSNKQQEKTGPLPWRSWAKVFSFFLFFKKAHRSQWVKSNVSSSYSLDLVGNHHRIFLANLVGGFSFVVVRAVMLVGVTVKSTKKVSTAAVETWNTTAEDAPSQTGDFRAAKHPRLPTGSLRRHGGFLELDTNSGISDRAFESCTCAGLVRCWCVTVYCFKMYYFKVSFRLFTNRCFNWETLI